MSLEMSISAMMSSVLGTGPLTLVQVSRRQGASSLIIRAPGDSGSPLLWVDDQARWSVAGIVSFGPSVCGQDVPGVYTRVEGYLGWIKTVIG